jgi:3-phenylpropionate/trans-cinnamate dioxygenase ferredoxin subunit
MMPWHHIALDNPLVSGEKTTVSIGNKEILVCHIDDDYFAVASRCTHSAWPLSSEPIEGMEIVCTLHGARFDLRDGCPSAGPASKPLTTYPIEFRDGELYVSFEDDVF